MQRFDDNESGYTATAKTITFTPVTTTTTTGSTTSAIKVASLSGLAIGDDISIGPEPVLNSDPLPILGKVLSFGTLTINLVSAIASAPAAGVAVNKVFLYDVSKLDNPMRDKINAAAVGVNIRAYQMYGTF